MCPQHRFQVEKLSVEFSQTKYSSAVNTAHIEYKQHSS